jgi:hypothetical protein
VPPYDYAASLAAINEHFQKESLLHAAIQPENRNALFNALASLGVTTVVVVFDGYGESGQIESVQARTGEADATLPASSIDLKQVRVDASGIDEVTVTMGEAIETLAYDLLEETHPGWENNDGAYGEFLFDVEARPYRSNIASGSPTSKLTPTNGEEEVMGHC